MLNDFHITEVVRVEYLPAASPEVWPPYIARQTSPILPPPPPFGKKLFPPLASKAVQEAEQRSEQFKIASKALASLMCPGGPTIQEGLLVQPAELEKHKYLSRHYLLWEAADIKTEESNILARITRLDKIYESANYVKLLKSYSRAYLQAITWLNEVNKKAATDPAGAVQWLVRDAEPVVTNMCQELKKCILLLQVGEDLKSILPGPSSVDLSAEDQERVKESERFLAKKRKEAPKQRGRKKGGRPFFPYGQPYSKYNNTGGNNNAYNAYNPNFNSIPAQVSNAMVSVGKQMISGQRDQRTCYHCNEIGHIKPNCPKR